MLFTDTAGLLLLTTASENVPPPYTAQVSGNTFWLNISNVTQADAEASCSANGGHLAAYLSSEEQKEVEAFYLKGGYLLPKFHVNYWIGFTASSWPNFTQIDRTFTTRYRNWGT
jgi:hypothetical protein